MLSIKGVIDLLNDNTRKLHPTIATWQDVYYGMSLHTTGACPRFRDERNNWPERLPFYFGERYQYIFETFLLSRHPREAESTRNFRLSQYKPYTKAPFQQIIESVTGAIFQDSNYTLVIDNKSDSDYIWGNNFEGKDLINYFSSKFQTICEDPNGFFVYIPKYAYYVTEGDVEPEIWFINSKDIISSTKDELIFLKENIAWHLNYIGIFRYAKAEDGKYFHIDEQYGGYYAHLQENLPIDFAGGVWNTQGFYDSWLSKAKACADDFVSSKSAEQLVDKEASHPFIIAATTVCPDCNGARTKQIACDECPQGFELIDCKMCHGSGEISYSPGKWMNAPPDEMDKDLIKIINPDIGINTYHKEKNADLYKMLLESLFLYRVEQAQSGVAKAIDQEDKYKFISKISSDYFDRLIPNAITIITSYRNVISNNGETKPAASKFTIVKPSQFQIKTATDLLLDFDASTKANMPAFIRAKQSLDYTDKQYGGDETIKKKAEFISQSDPLFVLSEADKQLQLLAGAIDKRQWQYSIHLPVMLEQIIRDKGKQWFATATYDDIKKEVDIIFATIKTIELSPPANNIPSQSNPPQNG